MYKLDEKIVREIKRGGCLKEFLILLAAAFGIISVIGILLHLVFGK